MTTHPPKILSATFVKGVVGDDAILRDKKPQIAFIGRSNVGKSSLVNALLDRKDLVKVSSTPGKTKEINFFLVNSKYYFVDLPGYGYAKVSPEEKEKILELIKSYLTAPHIKPAMVVLVIDCKVGTTDFDLEMLHLLREQGHPCIIAANKIDALNQSEFARALKQINANSVGATILPCSAKTKKGIDTLRAELLS
jgi:GTP-binding protein